MWTISLSFHDYFITHRNGPWTLIPASTAAHPRVRDVLPCAQHTVVVHLMPHTTECTGEYNWKWWKRGKRKERKRKGKKEVKEEKNGRKEKKEGKERKEWKENEERKENEESKVRLFPDRKRNLIKKVI